MESVLIREIRGLKMKKVGKSKENSTKSANTFCRNKPNSPIVQTDVTFFTTMYYTNFASLTKVKNKPNQTQFKANTNPIVERPKMNINIYYTIGYNNETAFRRNKNKPNSKPIKPNWSKASCPEFVEGSVVEKSSKPGQAMRKPRSLKIKKLTISRTNANFQIRRVI